MSDPLPPDLASALESTQQARGPFGSRVFYFHQTGSTNDLAARAAERGDPEGTLFVAAAQTAGRGRLGRIWFSPPDAGLYVSTIIRHAAVIPWVTLAAGVAIAEGIRSATGLPVQLKWPNDVVAVGSRAFSARRKIAGVLAEASSGPTGVQHVILGFGINLRAGSFPPELAGRAGSIEQELGRPIDGSAVLANVLVALHETMRIVVDSGAPALLERWLALSPSARGAAIEWDGSGNTFRSGTTAGVADDGALLVRTADGIERILSGEVRWR
jgi:BirA family biotin operon repressor/biotin-[acetyl-CoA-carboxylase] ligase